MATTDSIMKIPARTAIIGRIPGYNGAIDSTGAFEKELLKGVTFVDLRPMSYKFGDALKSFELKDIWDNKNNFTTRPGLFEADTSTSKKIFQQILNRMADDFKGMSPGFNNVDMIRIIGANDSTFQETFSNSYEGVNVAAEIANTAKNMAQNTKVLGTMTKGFKSYSHAGMMDLLGKTGNAINTAVNGQAGTTVGDMLTGAALGLKLAAPSMWNDSQYSSTLTMFVKLVAPVGTRECVQHNIIEPLLYLLAASSPITYGGIMYGYPLLWDVQAHGITNFRLGGIAAMSLMRGSFETTFNKDLQPTVIDVRLTIVPVMNDFAVQTMVGSEQESAYATPSALGTLNAGDLRRGILNDRSDMGAIELDRTVEITTIKL
jgi:hypothetical protein